MPDMVPKVNIQAARRPPAIMVPNEIFQLCFDEEIASFFAAAEHNELGESCSDLDGWGASNDKDQRHMIQSALEGLERSNNSIRDSSINVLLHVALGVPHQAKSQAQHLSNIRRNAKILVEEGVLETALTNFFSLCFSETPPASDVVPSLDTNKNIRAWAAIIHVVLEVARDSFPGAVGGSYHNNDTSIDDPRSTFGDRISSALAKFTYQGKSGVVELFLRVIHQFVDGGKANIPIKKVLVLCWKAAMLVLGDVDAVAKLKKRKRAAHGLDEFCTSVQAAEIADEDEGPLNLPIDGQSAVDRITTMAALSKAGIVSVPESNAQDDGEMTETEDVSDCESEVSDDGDMTETELDPELNDLEAEDQVGQLADFPEADEPSRQISSALTSKPNKTSIHKGTLRGKLGSLKNKKKEMRRKVTPKQLDALKAQFEDRPPTQMFWDGFEFKPPMALEEAVNILESNCYTSLRDVQIADDKKEFQERVKFRYDKPKVPEKDEEENITHRAESLFRNTVQHWAPLTISLLKLKFAAISTYGGGESKSRVNLNSELKSASAYEKRNEAECKGDSVLELAKEKMELKRHGEIILKALSSVLLLLLKHLHLNHVYQMEYLASRLCDANGIVLILKSVNVDVQEHFTKSIHQSYFEIFWGADATERDDVMNAPGISARTLQSTLNLLRILQKLTKRKHSRVLMLVKNKTDIFLRKLLRIHNVKMQLYVLKLIKSQVPFMSKMWKKHNMHVISAIDAKVTHHMVDDWVYANAVESADANQEDEEAFNEAAKRYIQRYVSEPDSLECMLGACSVFDMYQLAV